MNLNFKNSILPFLLLLIGISSCSQNDITTGNEQKKTTLSFLLDAPVSTRAELSNETITAENVGFYGFSLKENNAHELKVMSNKNNLKVNIEGEKIKVEILIPATIKEELKGIITIDSSFWGNYTPKIGDSYRDFITALEHKVTERVNVTQRTPLAGTFLFDTRKNLGIIPTQLIRSFAQVKVNLKPSSNKKYNFKAVESLNIYRSNDRYAIVPQVEDVHANTSQSKSRYKLTIPSNPLYLLENGPTPTTKDIAIADKYPLVFKSKIVGEDKELEPIFLHEELLKKNGDRDEVVTAVVGVTLDDATIQGVRYYRLDFAKYGEDGKPIEYNSILRNKIYNFVLNGANTPGTLEPEDALSENAELFLDFQEWDAHEIDGKDLNGQYYFKLSQSSAVLENKANNRFEIPFETNIAPKDILDNRRARWYTMDDQPIQGGSKNFKTATNASKSFFVITSINENTTKDDIEEYVVFTLYNHSFRINVTQKHKPAVYKFVQESAKVNGVYILNTDNSKRGTSTINVKFYAEKEADIKGLSYKVTSSVVDGIYVEGKGDFKNIMNENGLFTATASLKVHGAATRPGNKVIVLETDSEIPSYMPVTIPLAYTPKKIVGIYASNDATPKLSANAGFQKLIEYKGTNPASSNRNFGISVNSKVKTEKITYVEEIGKTITLNYLINLDADMVIVQKNLSDNEADAIYDYTSKRYLKHSPNGKTAFLIMNGDGTIHSLLQKAGASTSTSGSITQVVMGSRPYSTPISQAGHRITTADYHFRYYVPFNDWDIITNSSFGQLGALSPQMSSGAMAYVNVDYQSIVSYMGNAPFFYGGTNIDNAYTFFRLLDLPVIWIGDKNFLTNQKHWNFDSNEVIERLQFNHFFTHEKAPLPVGLAYNGFVMASILESAFEISENGFK